MNRAMEEAHISASDIDFLLANGSGIPQEDVQEAHAVQTVFENKIKKLLFFNVDNKL